MTIVPTGAPADAVSGSVDPITCFRAVLASGRRPDEGSQEFPFRALHELGWQRICDELARRCVTDDAVELASALGVLPWGGVAVRHRDEVAELAAHVATEEPPPIRGTRSVGRSIVRARKDAVLAGKELFDVASSVVAADRTAAYFRNARGSVHRVAEHAVRLVPLKTLASSIQHCVSPSGDILDDASPELARLRRKVAGIRDQIQGRLDRILRSPRFEGILQDDYVTVRDERYVVPIRSGERGDFPGIVHGSSNSGATLFIEPQELVALNNEFRVAQLKVHDEEQRILTMLSRQVASHANELEDNQDILTYLDLLCAKARLAIDIDAEYPELVGPGPGAMIRLHETRHPILVLKQLAEGGLVVPNDIRLAAGTRILVVSGPNTGGKTVTLKTLGLFAILSRAGMPVPCGAGGTLPLFRTLWSDIGDEQNVENDLSTFSAHVRNIAAFLPACTQESLVLLDELFAGTDPEQGAALGRALLEELARRGTWVVVTTHLEKLKTLAFEDGRFACASVGFDVDRLQPTFALRMGVPGGSYALRIAARLGLSNLVVERAEEMLGTDGSANREEILDRMQREMAAIADERQELARLRRDAQAALKDADARRRMARAEMDKELRDEERELRSALDSLRRDIREQSARLREAGTATDEQFEKMRRQTSALEKSGRQVSRQLRASASQTRAAAGPPGPSLDVDTLAEGDAIFVVPFKKAGVVASKPRRGERVTVQVGQIRATFAVEDLRPMTRSENAQQKATVSFARVEAASDAATTLDLRGVVVDDAMEQLDVFLDRAERARLFQVVVIHGHGTGAIKRAVRGFLGESRRGFHYRPGERSEGGDGVTVVYLDGPPPTDDGTAGSDDVP